MARRRHEYDVEKRWRNDTHGLDLLLSRERQGKETNGKVEKEKKLCASTGRSVSS